ncbi:MAG: hypothetical protein J6T10_21575 [Methanobrevibacter sp.]|nr:hypothetical protein [Methanobrevibacter sp.]
MKKVSKELKFIKGFSSTSLNRICNEVGIDRANLVKNQCKEEDVLKVYNKLITEFADMLKESIKEDS